MVVTERQILKPRAPALTDENDWEIFQLSKVHIRDAKTGDPINLLFVDEKSPATVTGQLEVLEKRQNRCLLHPPYSKPMSIEIPNVMRYSYGVVEEDDDVIFWVAGEAGWHQIIPSRTYKPVFDEMVEAIRLIYFCADMHRDSRFRSSGPSAQTVFQEFTEDPRFNCPDSKAAAEFFYKHKKFLIQCMVLRKEGITWSKKPLYYHMRNLFPEEFQAARERTQNAAIAEAQDEKPEASSKRDSKESQSGGQSKSSTEKKLNGLSTRRDENWWKAFVVWELIQKARLQNLFGPGKITMNALAQLMFKRYHINDSRQAIEYIRYHSANLLAMMDRPKSQRIYAWSEEPLYKELRSSASATSQRRTPTLELRLREKPLPDTDSSAAESDSSSSGTQLSIRARARKGKSSVLRPRGKKYAGKATGRTGDVITLSDENEDGYDHMELSTPSKRKGEDGTSKPRKRTITRSQAHLLYSSDTETEDIIQAEGITDSLPLRGKGDAANAKPSRHSIAPSIVTSSIPIVPFNAPPDVFICALDGCNHRIYCANNPASQELIQAHYDEHSNKNQLQLDLVMNEEHLSNLPVSNLIKKIQELAAQQENIYNPFEEPTKLEFPSPIIRRL